MSADPVWLTFALQDLGVREVKGAPTAPRIAAWLAELQAWWADDETPWCGTAVAAWVKASGCSLPTHWYRAKAWVDWGAKLSRPVRGCIVVFDRAGGGHVGLVAGTDQRGRLLVLGGNQGDAVCISPFERNRVVAYRWPTEAAWPADAMRPTYTLPLYASAEASSENEA